MRGKADERYRQAARRWQQIEVERPDLEAAVRLQRILVRRIIDLVQLLSSDRSLVAPAASAVLRKLAAGRPFLRHEPVVIPVSALSASLVAFCTDLAEAGAGDAARRVREVLERGRIDAASLLLASLDRRTVAIRNGATQQGLSPDLLWLVAELAAGPIAYVLQHRVCADLDAAGHPTVVLEDWDRGDCPACGSWPAFAECREVAWLRCSFCGAAWRLRTDRCPYCDNAGQTFVTAAPDLARPRRLRLCGACGGYLKAIDIAVAAPFELLPVEDLASSDLDLGALERGYHRPSLPETPEGPESIPPCPGAEPADLRRTVAGGRMPPSR